MIKKLTTSDYFKIQSTSSVIHVFNKEVRSAIKKITFNKTIAHLLMPSLLSA